MTKAEKIELVKAMCEETEGSVISAYLELAGRKICRIAYPFDYETMTVPDRYEHIQIEAAVYLLNKRGGEGEKAHTENGISRTYENGDLPYSLVRQIVPMAGVVK